MPQSSEGYLSNWHELRYIPEQAEYWKSTARFNLVAAGRRSGKTELAKRKIILRALRGTRFPNPQFFIAAPTRPQVKRIYWQDMLELTRTVRVDKSSTELWLRLLNGASIHMLGMDTPARIEGTPWDGGVLDEYGNMREEAFPQNVRPALSDRLGWCDLIGVPEGRNHYWETWEKAPGREDWARFSWPSSIVLPPEEIQSAREELDELSFAQEYEAAFVSFGGIVYSAWNPKLHLAPLRYSDQSELIFCFDFNAEPGPAVIAQEQKLPSGEVGTGIIGEVFIPRQSTTERVCRRLIEDWGKHKGPIVAYGDATGGTRGSKAVRGSDWDIVRETLRPAFGSQIVYRVPLENPKERPRVNSVNARLRNAAGQIRMMVDPSRAPNVVRDFEGTALIKGGSFEIDKHSNPSLTHLTDAVGYYVHHRFPARGTGVNYIEVKQRAG